MIFHLDAEHNRQQIPLVADSSHRLRDIIAELRKDPTSQRQHRPGTEIQQVQLRIGQGLPVATGRPCPSLCVQDAAAVEVIALRPRHGTINEAHREAVEHGSGL